MRRILFPALLVAILFAQLGATAAQGRRTALRSGAVVKTALNKKLGKTILVDAAGLALYEFESDYGGRPGCVNDSTYHCSKHWVPLLTTGQPHAVGTMPVQA